MEIVKKNLTEFAKFLNEKGITITQLSDYKNIATNWQQEIRQKFKNCNPYKREQYIKDMQKTIEIPAYIPSLDDLEELVQMDGKLGAFNEFATKVIEAHKRLVKKFDGKTPTDFLTAEELDEWYERRLAIPYRAEQTENQNKIIELELQKPKLEFDFLDGELSNEEILSENDLYSYIEANQIASSLGNLILAEETNSNDPRNFLYKIFDMEYHTQYIKDVLFTPALSGSELERYKTKFYEIQGLHRKYEKEKNYHLVHCSQKNMDLKKENVNKKAAAENKFNEESKDYAYAMSQLINKRTELSELASKYVDKLRTEYEQIGSQRKLEALEYIYSLKVWLPEKAREITEALKDKVKV